MTLNHFSLHFWTKTNTEMLAFCLGQKYYFFPEPSPSNLRQNRPMVRKRKDDTHFSSVKLTIRRDSMAWPGSHRNVVADHDLPRPSTAS